MKKLVQLGATALLIAASAAGAHAGVLYSQSYDGTDYAFASQNDTSGRLGEFITAYDDFTLGSAAQITSVGFTGEYFQDTPAPITAFTLSIYADNAGQPGAPIYSVNVAGDAGQTSIGGPGPAYTYSIATNFNAAAGTSYWLSVVPDLAYPEQWGWLRGVGGDGVSYQACCGTRFSNAGDLAFTLNGGVPEPATWAMLILGVGMIGVAARRRREATAVAA